MRDERIISVNLVVSFFGIYLSYFYFGLNQYNYISYFFFDIIKSSVVLSILVALPLVIILHIISNFSNFKKIFISILIGLESYIVFHYLIRFSDINYYYIFLSIAENENLLIKVFFYFFPFIILFFYSLKLSEKKFLRLINLFLFCLWYLIFSLYRTYVIYVLTNIKDYKFSDYKYFQVNSVNNSYSNKKIFILLFDEFDQSIFKKNIEKLDNIRKIYNTSYVNKKFYSPAKFTLDSIPAILTGNSSKRTIVKNGKLFVKNHENDIIQFNHENSLFNIDNTSYSIFAYYHPYCKFFEAKPCHDKFHFVKNNITLINSIKILLDVTYINRINSINLLLNKFFYNEIETSDFSKFMIENSLNFLKSNNDIIYIHYPFPHLPLKKNIIDFDERNETLSDYEKNLFLVDYTFQLINKFLENNQDSLLVVLSDHWHKDISEKSTTVFSKIIGDDTYIEDDKENNSSNLKGLIKKFLKNEINSNYDIKKYFELKKPWIVC